MNAPNNISQAKQTRQTACVARERLLALLDPDTFLELFPFAGNEGSAGVITGSGYIADQPVYVFSQDSTVDHGAMTVVQAAKIKKIYDLAEKTGCPVIALFDSNGAKVSQANEMLTAYSEILSKANRLSGMVPQFALVLGPCTGTAALLACSADLLLIAEGGELFLNPPFVTATKEPAPDKNIAGAVAIGQAGIAAVVSPDEPSALATLRQAVSMFPQNNLAPAPLVEDATESTTLSALATIGETLSLRQEATPILTAVADQDSLLPLWDTFGTGVRIALGTVAGAPVGMIAHDPANGDLDADACDKTVRFVQLCDAFHIPLVTFVNTAGFALTANPLLIRHSARLAHAYSEATTPQVTFLIGQAIGAAYLAFAAPANDDLTLAWPSAAISAMPLEATVEFLHHDKLKGTTDLEASRGELIADYLQQTAGAFRLAEQGHIDGVIAPAETRDALISAIELLASKRQSNLPKKHAVMPL